MSDSRNASSELLEVAAGNLEEILGSLRELGRAASATHDDALRQGRRTSRKDFISLRPLIRDQLKGLDPNVAGMGILARRGLLADASMFVEWWCAGALEPFLMRVSLDPDHAVFSDYNTFEWFEGPWHEGSTRVAGPWVDYTGTGEHVMTLSVPVFAQGGENEFLGVVGADVLVGQIEELVMDPMRRIRDDAALVNTDGRVIASNTSRLLVGSLLDDADARWAAHAEVGWTTRDDGAAAGKRQGLPWSVVVFERS